MPRKGGTATAPRPGSQPTVNSNQAAAPGFFPFARYISTVGIHTSLLAFTALFLPHASRTLQAPLASVSFLQGLTNNPALTLAWICGGIIPLQGWWAGWVRKWMVEFSTKGIYLENKMKRSERDKDKFAKLRNAWLGTFVTSFAIHAVIVLFGAPLLSHYLRTYLLACLISILTVFTPAYVLGLPSLASDSRSLLVRLTWTRMFAELSPRTAVERAIVYPIVGAAIGSWAGAFPIALDWGRPWQAWPLTPAYAAILGYIFGSLGALCVRVTELSLFEDSRLHSSKTAKTS